MQFRFRTVNLFCNEAELPTGSNGCLLHHYYIVSYNTLERARVNDAFSQVLKIKIEIPEMVRYYVP